MTANFAPVDQGTIQAMDTFLRRVLASRPSATDEQWRAMVSAFSQEWRGLVRRAAGLTAEQPAPDNTADALAEFGFLVRNHQVMSLVFKQLTHKRVLYAGQSYYHAWYLSRALRPLGWRADVLNWDLNPASQLYYHGEDIAFDASSPTLATDMLWTYLAALYDYDVFHFSNAFGLSLGAPLKALIAQQHAPGTEIALLRALGKKIVYSNNSCADGVLQSTFAKWGPESACAICRWQHEPAVCGDERNTQWGKYRNEVADFQVLSGGNHADFNLDPRVHEVAEFYCLDPELWHPALEIPDEFRLPPSPEGTVRLYHAVGERATRTRDDGKNIKSTHVYLPLIDALQQEGLRVELIAPTGIRNRDVRYLQAQADVVLDMLSYGWFGANAREAMMLGKPVVCFIRPEWLESVRAEMPEYAAQLPIVSATAETVEAELRALVGDVDRRREIGARSRAFALRWHSADAGARRFDEIYTRLLRGESLRRE